MAPFKEDQPASGVATGDPGFKGAGGGGLSAGRTELSNPVLSQSLFFLSDPRSCPQLFALTLQDRAPRSQLGDGRLRGPESLN